MVGEVVLVCVEVDALLDGLDTWCHHEGHLVQFDGMTELVMAVEAA